MGGVGGGGRVGAPWGQCISVNGGGGRSKKIIGWKGGGTPALGNLHRDLINLSLISVLSFLSFWSLLKFKEIELLTFVEF